MLDKRIETPGLALIIKTSNLKQEKTQHFNLRLYKLVSVQEEQKPRSSPKETCLRQIQAFMLLLLHLKKGKKKHIMLQLKQSEKVNVKFCYKIGCSLSCVSSCRKTRL